MQCCPSRWLLTELFCLPVKCTRNLHSYFAERLYFAMKVTALFSVCLTLSPTWHQSQSQRAQSHHPVPPHVGLLLSHPPVDQAGFSSQWASQAREGKPHPLKAGFEQVSSQVFMALNFYHSSLTLHGAIHPPICPPRDDETVVKVTELIHGKALI